MKNKNIQTIAIKINKLLRSIQIAIFKKEKIMKSSNILFMAILMIIGASNNLTAHKTTKDACYKYCKDNYNKQMTDANKLCKGMTTKCIDEPEKIASDQRKSCETPCKNLK